MEERREERGRSRGEGGEERGCRGRERGGEPKTRRYLTPSLGHVMSGSVFILGVSLTLSVPPPATGRVAGRRSGTEKGLRRRDTHLLPRGGNRLSAH